MKKREAYRAAFHQFDPAKIAQMTEQDIDRCMENAGLIRHRAKLEAIVKNAKAYLAMEKCGENFSNFVWSFVNHQPIINDVDVYKRQLWQGMKVSCQWWRLVLD